MSPREPKRIGEVAKKLVGGQAKRAVASLREADAKWREVVGDDVADKTRVLGVSRRILRVAVPSSAMLAELTGFYRDGILEGLQSGERPLPVKDVRFEIDSEA